MAPTTPTGVPSAVVAGDSWRWRIADFSDYPQSAGWSLSYRVLGEDTPLDVTVAWQTTGDDANYWLATVTTTDSDLLPGLYRLVGKLTGSGTYAGRAVTVSNAPLHVARNPATAAAGDFQSQAQQDLAAINEVLSGRITADLESYTVAGRQLTKIPVQQLWAMRSALEARVRMQRTGSMETPVLVEFSRVGG